MNGGRAASERLHRVNNSLQVLVFHLDQRERFHRRYFVLRCHRRHRLPDVEHLIPGHNPTVPERPGAEEDVREVAARNDTPHAGQRLGIGGVDTDYTGVTARAGQHLAHQHLRQVDVAGVGGVTGHLVERIDADVVLAENIELCHLCYSVSFVLSTAAITASMTLE